MSLQAGSVMVKLSAAQHSDPNFEWLVAVGPGTYSSPARPTVISARYYDRMANYRTNNKVSIPGIFFLQPHHHRYHALQVLPRYIRNRFFNYCLGHCRLNLCISSSTALDALLDAALFNSPVIR